MFAEFFFLPLSISLLLRVAFLSAYFRAERTKLLSVRCNQSYTCGLFEICFLSQEFYNWYAAAHCGYVQCTYGYLLQTLSCVLAYFFFTATPINSYVWYGYFFSACACCPVFVVTCLSACVRGHVFVAAVVASGLPSTDVKSNMLSTLSKCGGLKPRPSAAEAGVITSTTSPR